MFEFNPDVTFKTIQYSKSNKKVYFYTDKTVDAQAWKESRVTKYKPLSNISLYDIANLTKKISNNYL